MKFSYPVLLIALIIFSPAILPWVFTYILYFSVDIGIALYIFSKCGKHELISPVLYLSIGMIVMNTINLTKGYCKLGNYLLGAMIAFFCYGMERCIYVQKRNSKLDKFIHQFSQIAIFVNVLSLIFLLFNWNKRNIDNYIFLFGSKFDSIYILLLGIVLNFADKNRNSKKTRKGMTLLLLMYCAWFSWSLNCMTTLLFTLFVFTFVLLPFDILKNFFRKPLYLGIIISIAGTFPFWNILLLNLPIVQRVIITIFHRNLGLTGRIYIYSNMKNILSTRLVTGYGHGTKIIKERLGMGNTQNGMTEFILQYGIVLAIGFVFMIVFYLKVSDISLESKSWIFFGMTLGMMLISTVEVVYDSLIFYFTLFICYYVSSNNILKYKHPKPHERLVLRI